MEKRELVEVVRCAGRKEGEGNRLLNVSGSFSSGHSSLQQRTVKDVSDKLGGVSDKLGGAL